MHPMDTTDRPVREPALVDRVRARLAAAGGGTTPAAVAAAVRAEANGVASDLDVLAALRLLRQEFVGAGPLDELLRDPRTTDVLVSGPASVWVDRGAGLEPSGLRFPDEAAVRRLAQRLAVAAGRRLDDASPYVDGWLADAGVRLHAVLSPVAVDGTCLSLRVLRPAAHDLSTLRRLGTVDATGENSIVVVPRANLAVSPEQVRAAAPALDGADVVLLQQELPLDSIREAARIARDAGSTVVLNPAPVVDGTRELRGLVDVLVPNEPEARALVGGVETGPEAVGKSLLEDWRLDSVVLTLGSGGALIVDHDSATPIPPHHVDAVDTVGAGDVFCGSLAAGLARGEDFAVAVRYANVAAALSVTRVGGADSVPTYDEVQGLLRER